MKNKPSDDLKPGTALATWTPADLAQAVLQAHPEWGGQPLDARALGQALRVAFGLLREKVDAVELGTVAVPSLGRFHVRRAPNKPDLRRVLFLTPKGNDPAANTAPVSAAAAAETPPAVPVAEIAAESVAAEPEGTAPAKTAPKTAAKPRSKTTNKSSSSSKRKR